MILACPNYKKNNVEIIAHRGYLLFFPENTLVAFQRALCLGANGIELDVQMSRDRVPVVIHDETVDRTTDGHGPVTSLDFRELKQLDAGAKFSIAFRGERIPSLREALLTIRDKGKAYIELKKSVHAADIEIILREIHSCKMERQVTLISFNFNQLEIARNCDLSITLGKLLLPSDFNLDRMLQAGISLACAPYKAFLEFPELLPILTANKLIPNANGITNRRTAKFFLQEGIHILGCEKPI